jgi:serine O-acetyltransferase
MKSLSISSGECIRREAENAVARDPVFGAALSSAILDHPDFAHALAHQIGARFGKSPADRERFARLPAKRLRPSPDLIDAASRDLQSIAVHDPATTTLLPPLLNFKGYVALQPGASPTGSGARTPRSRAAAAKPVVRSASGLHSSVRVDRHVGISRSRHRHHRRRVCRDRRRGDDPAERHHRPKTVRAGPRTENRQGVYLSAGSTIIGGVSIGDFAKVGAGAVVEHDVPPGCTAVGVPARLTNCPEPM